MLMMSVKMVLFVDQTIAQLHLVLTLKLIVVFQVHALVPVGILNIKVITIVMMKTIIVDVIGMEETVVAVMLTHNIVQLVNA